MACCRCIEPVFVLRLSTASLLFTSCVGAASYLDNGLIAARSLTHLPVVDSGILPSALRANADGVIQNRSRRFCRDISTSCAKSRSYECRFNERVPAIAMARGLDIEVAAEGVETLTQLEFLKECQCDLAQGFLISRPMHAKKVSAILRSEIAGTRLLSRGMP